MLVRTHIHAPLRKFGKKRKKTHCDKETVPNFLFVLVFSQQVSALLEQMNLSMYYCLTKKNRTNKRWEYGFGDFLLYNFYYFFLQVFFLDGWGKNCHPHACMHACILFCVFPLPSVAVATDYVDITVRTYCYLRTLSVLGVGWLRYQVGFVLIQALRKSRKYYVVLRKK